MSSGFVRWLTPDNALIFAGGDIPLGELIALLEARLGSLRALAIPRGPKAFGAPLSPQSFGSQGWKDLLGWLRYET